MRSNALKSLLLLAVAVGCNDRLPTAGRTSSDPSFSRESKDEKAAERAALLTDIPVSALNFAGTLTVTRLAYDEATGQLLISGTMTRSLDGATDTFTDVPATFTPMTTSSSRSSATPARYSIVAASYTGAANAQGQCPVLLLSIQPIHLDVLGLVVDLSLVVLDVHSVQGPGNLLGNLLCALTGLLDGVGTPTPPTPITMQQLQAQIDRINAILGI